MAQFLSPAARHQEHPKGAVISFGDIGTETLSGSGSIVLTPYASNSSPAILSIGSSCTLTQTAGHSITGAGDIGAPNSASGLLVNQGLIAANVSAQPLNVLIGIGLTNSGGTVEATSGGTLVLKSGINNASGILQATDGGVLVLSGSVSNANNAILSSGGTVLVNGSIGGGTLASSGSSYFSINGGTLNSVTIAPRQHRECPITGCPGRRRIDEQRYDKLPQRLDGQFGGINFNGQQTLTGSGTIVLGPYTNFPPQVTTQGGTLTQAAGHTISGAGLIAQDSQFWQLRLFHQSGIDQCQRPGGGSRSNHPHH